MWLNIPTTLLPSFKSTIRSNYDPFDLTYPALILFRRNMSELYFELREYLGYRHLQISRTFHRHQCAPGCMIWPFVADIPLKWWVPAAQFRHIEETLALHHLLNLRPAHRLPINKLLFWRRGGFWQPLPGHLHGPLHNNDLYLLQRAASILT